MNSDEGTSVTLIFYRVGERWWKEPFLNILAAAAQMSQLTHVEIAIGGARSRIWNALARTDSRTRPRRLRAAEEAGANGTMKNVCRVFNDKIGVELVERTGRNPQVKCLIFEPSSHQTPQLRYIGLF